MFASTQTLLKLSLPLLSTVFLLSASGTASAASDARIAPGRTAERIAAATTVVATQHYQAMLGLTCSAGVCAGNFPAIGARRRLNLTRMSCYMRSSTYATYATGKIELEPDNVLVQYLPADHSTEWGHHTLNRAIDVQIAARQYVSVALSLASGGQAFEATCTTHGTLETLQ